jgi:hypothetical protein
MVAKTAQAASDTMSQKQMEVRLLQQPSWSLDEIGPLLV